MAARHLPFVIWRPRPTHLVWGIGAVVVLVTVLCAGLTIWDLRRKTLIETSEEMSTLGLVLAEQTSRYVQVVDLLLQEIQARSRQMHVTTPEQFRGAFGDEAAHRFLRERILNLPEGDMLGIIDADGRLLTDSLEQAPEHIDLSDRDVYSHFHSGNDTGLFVGPANKGKLTGRWTIYVARRISAPDGALLGMVAGGIDVKYLTDFYHAISTNKAIRVTLLRRDGTPLARYPDEDTPIGAPVPPTDPWHVMVAAGGGNLRSPGAGTGFLSIVAIKPLQSYPLVVDVAIQEPDALAVWREQVIYVVSGEFVAAATFILLFWLIGRQFRRQEEQQLVLVRTAEAARLGELRLRDYAEMGSDWFWEQDAELRFVLVTAGTSMIGPDDTPFVGRKRWEMLETDTQAERWEAHKADLAARRPFRDFRYTLMGRDARLHHVSVSGNPVFDSAGNFIGYHGTGRDITADIDAAEALRLARDEAEAANRAKSEFLANMSHELRTPLNAIIGFAELIRDHPFAEKDARCVDYARDIYASGRHLLDLINDVLDMSKIEMGYYTLREEPVEVEEVVRACRGMLSVPAIEGQVDIKIDDFAGTRLYADRLALKQIALNLLANAVKFTLPGGQVRIAGLVAPSGEFRLMIADSGIGVSEAALPYLCDPFYQADTSRSRAHGGTGLGLAICSRLLKLHGGRLEIESERGHGTTVGAVFPAERVLPRSRVRQALT